MPNVVLNDLLYTKMTLASLGGRLGVCRNMSGEYSSEFAKEGHKIGDKLQVRKPQRYTLRRGMKYAAQPLTNTQTEVKIDQVYGVDFEWDGIERTLQLDYIQKMYVDPVVDTLANGINADAAQFIALNTFNNVGTPGTTPNDVATYLAAGDKLIELGMPENYENDLTLILNRKMSSAMVKATATYFNKGSIVSKQHQDGNMVDQLGYKIVRDQTIYTHTTGTYAGTILVNGANQGEEGGNNGTGTLITDGHTSGQSTIKAGDHFRITGVMSVHPITRKPTGDLQDFVALTTQTDVTGAMTIVHSPAKTASGQYQNIDVLAADNAPLIFPGAAGVTSTRALVMHENASAFVCVPMVSPDPSTGVKATNMTDPDTGITISRISYFDGDNRIQKNRFDVLCGFSMLYREMACVLYGS